MSWVFLGILGALASIAVPVMVVVLVVRAGRRGRGPVSSPGAPVRRFFQYGLLFAGFLMVSAGITSLGQAAVETAPFAGRGRLAGPLALLIVGGPLFAVLSAWTRKRLASDPGERLSIGWLLYLTLALTTSLIVAMYGAMESIGWGLGSRDAGAASLVMAAVWAVGWVLHWRAALVYVPPDDGRSHRLVGSLIGLTTALGTVIALGAIAATWAYDEVTGRAFASTIGDDVRSLAGPAVVALAVWWWYWLRGTRRITPTVGWHAYVLLAGVLGGVLIVVTSAGVGLFTVLEFALGRSSEGAVDHFAVVPGVAVAAGIGLLTWFYHGAVSRSTAPEASADVARSYTYLLAAVGLVAAATGSTVLLAALFDALGGARELARGSGIGSGVLAGLTMLAVGLPMWWMAWIRAHRSGLDEADERASLPRRLYLSGSFGLGGVIAVIALLAAAATFFQDLLEGNLGAATLRMTRVSLALVVTVGVIAAYHWRVFRADRSVGPSVSRRVFDHLLLLLPGDGSEVARRVADRTGARVEVWRLSDGAAVGEAAVLEALEGLSGPDGIVIAGDDGIRALDARRS